MDREALSTSFVGDVSLPLLEVGEINLKWVKLRHNILAFSRVNASKRL